MRSTGASSYIYPANGGTWDDSAMDSRPIAPPTKLSRRFVFALLVLLLSLAVARFVFREAISINEDTGSLVKQGFNSTENLTHTNEPYVIPLQRWNRTQLQHFLQNITQQNFSKEELLHLVPKPLKGGDDVQLYNIKAWHRLRNLLAERPTTEANAKRTIRLCSVGGSSTAGGGDIPSYHLWDKQYIEMLQYTGISSNPLKPVQVINRAHGDRGSVHAAFVMHSIVPADVDIIVWEFSVNDGHSKGCQEVNNGIIIWLDQIQRMWPDNPPLVILAYLWDPNVGGRYHRFIYDSVFQCHGHLAAAYDFVVGSVHLGSYVRNLQPDVDSVRPFLADNHHPNALGHWFLAFLLSDLTTDTTRSPMETNKLYDHNGTLPGPNWNCSVLPSEKKLVKDLLDTQDAFASWTAEVPRNEEDGDFNQGMLIPHISNVNHATLKHHNLSFVSMGKSSKWRMDRKRSVVLPCCSSEERLSFDDPSVVVHSQKISAVQIYAPDLRTEEDLANSISVKFLASHPTSSLGNVEPSWVTFASGECRLGYWFLNTWLVFQEPLQAISRLALCNSRPTCGDKNVPPVTIMHVVLY